MRTVSADTPKVRWDPLFGSVDFGIEAVPPSGPLFRVPHWLKTALGIMAIASLPALLAGLIWHEMLFVGAGLIALSVGGLLGIDALSKNAESHAWRMSQLATRNGWAFKSVKATVRSSQKSGGRRVMHVDPLFKRIADTVPELIRSRPGQLIPMTSNGIFWGQTASGVPFMLSVGQYDVDATFTTSGNRKDRFGNVAPYGRMYGFLMAYRLDRDTRIRATLLGEVFDRDGWKDIKTESVEFNNRFRVAIHGESAPDAQLALLQALTPATQTRLLALADLYNAQLVLDGSTVWLGGHERLMSEDPDEIASRFSEITEAFADAATSFKRYSE